MLYADISPRTNAYADRRLLSRNQFNNIIGQFGQTRTLPKNATQVISFRRYNKLDSTPAQLTEGVTPAGKTLTRTDVTATIRQYGDWIRINDVIRDTHEDPILNESIDILGDQAREMYNRIYAGVILAGTNVLFSNGTNRAGINTSINGNLLDRAVRALEGQHAQRIRKVMTAGPNIGTVPIPASFILLCHSDLRQNLEGIAGWIPVHQYASQQGIINGEAGAIRQFRVVFDNHLARWENAGALIGTTGLLGGTNVHVYPLLALGEDAFGTILLGGKGSVSTYVNNPKAITGDELAQRGSVGWKGWTTAAILQDLHMVRLEAGVSALA